MTMKPGNGMAEQGPNLQRAWQLACLPWSEYFFTEELLDGTVVWVAVDVADPTISSVGYDLNDARAMLRDARTLIFEHHLDYGLSLPELPAYDPGACMSRSVETGAWVFYEWDGSDHEAR